MKKRGRNKAAPFFVWQKTWRRAGFRRTAYRLCWQRRMMGAEKGRKPVTAGAAFLPTQRSWPIRILLVELCLSDMPSVVLEHLERGRMESRAFFCSHPRHLRAEAVDVSASVSREAGETTGRGDVVASVSPDDTGARQIRKPPARTTACAGGSGRSQRTRMARRAFKMASRDTPTSAKTAIHMLLMPRAPSSRNNALTPSANTMF